MADGKFRHEELAFPKKEEKTGKLIIKLLNFYRYYINRCLKRSRRFTTPTDIWEMMKSVEGICQIGNISGEGWFLTAEMI